MNPMLRVAEREIKIGFRNPWSYSFLALFSLFSLILLLIQARNAVAGYTGITAAMLNLILYLLPLMTLLLGSFSLTAEKEEGGWELLSTYPIRTFTFVFGKFAGMAAVLLAIIAFGFGLAGLFGALFGRGLDFATFALFFVFSVGLAMLFLAVALIIGTLAENRWQAMTMSVAVWFFAIIAWPSLLIAGLGLLPYVWVKPAVTLLTMLNPAELVRLFTVVKLGGGSVLGPEYYRWVEWIKGPSGSLSFLGLVVLWIGAALAYANFSWERRRKHG